MEKAECSICNNTFDGSQHRPRALPCGHGFCTECIDACIARGNKLCPVCRVSHGANLVKQLPVNFPLEELLEKATISKSQKHVSDTETEEESVDMCIKHKRVPLHFQCKSHEVKVCHSCAVIDHPPSSCRLISLDDHAEEMKKSEIVVIQKREQCIIDIEKDLKWLHQRTIGDVNEQIKKKQVLEKEIELLLAKVEDVDKDIVIKRKTEEYIKDDIRKCQKNQKAFNVLKNKLRNTTGNNNILRECQTVTTQITKSQKWEEKLKSGLRYRMVTYAQVKRNGILRSSRVISVGVRTLISSLSEEVTPPTAAELIQEAELGLTSSTNIVFLDLSAKGCNLGRIHIRVQTDRLPGKQFVMLALGTHGPTFKMATFGERHNNCIVLKEYFTESKSKSDAALITLNDDYCEKAVRGRLYPRGGPGFAIITKDCERSFFGRFGEVITGLEVVDKIASGDLAITDIMISDCGIMLEN